jgi:RNA recognition motif-containing protein
MTNKLYVGNLSYEVSEDKLRSIFGQYGGVEDVKLIVDRDTQRSRGFAFVTMETEEEASNAMSNLAETEVEGRPIKVSEAKERQNRRPNNRNRNNERRNNRW